MNSPKPCGLQHIGDVIQSPGGQLILKARMPHRISLTKVAMIKEQADGSYLLLALPEWIEVKQASRLIGVSKKSVIRLCEEIGRDGKPILQIRRPGRRRVQISLESVNEYQRRIESDPEFWDSVPKQPQKACGL